MDSILVELQNATEDTSKIKLRYEYGEKAFILREGFWDSLATDAENLEMYDYVGSALNNLAYVYSEDGRVDLALGTYFRSLSIKQKINDFGGQGSAYLNIGFMYHFQSKYDTAMVFYKKAIPMFDKAGDSSGIASTINNIAYMKYTIGDMDSAFHYFELALEIKRGMNDKRALANGINNLAEMYNIQGNIPKALSYYRESLKIYDDVDDKSGMGVTLHNLAAIYLKQNNYTEAETNFIKSIALLDAANNMRDIVRARTSYAKFLKEKGKYSESIDVLNQALEQTKEQNNPSQMAQVYYSLGGVYFDQGEMEKAESYFQESYSIQSELGESEGMSQNLTSLSFIYLSRGELSKALNSGNTALELAKDLGFPEHQRDASKVLYQTYKAQGNKASAFDMLELYMTMRDSLNNIENKEGTLQLEYQYTYEKKRLEDSLISAEKDKLSAIELEKKDAEIAQADAELENKKLQQYALFGGLSLFIVFSLFIYNRFRITRKQRDIIEDQKEEVEAKRKEAEYQRELVEEKNTEILDSINYAKRIQSAILPPKKLVKEYLSDSFVLYKPKDIVAGDFYWMEPFQSDKQNESGVLFAAADCTGHGVPGAMVSVVCNNGLNRSVREHGLLDPGKILDKTREIVISEFEKSEEEVKDGMDIALCSLTFSQRDEHSESGSSNSSELELKDRTVSDYTALLKYAGAHNPLWIIRKDAEYVEEIKANKQPIGKYDEPTPYDTHTIELNTGDTFYTFSDGYADQFGGEKGKKLKSKNFKSLLLSIQKESMERQRELIDEAFETWKGDFEQLDDVCVIGVRV